GPGGEMGGGELARPELIAALVVDHEIGTDRNDLLRDRRGHTLDVDALAAGVDHFEADRPVPGARPRVEPRRDVLRVRKRIAVRIDGRRGADEGNADDVRRLDEVEIGAAP